MLVPAVLYKDEIKRKILEYKYTNDMMYYSGWLGDSIPNIDDDSEDNCTVQYAIVDGDNLIGYFTYMTGTHHVQVVLACSLLIEGIRSLG